MAPMAKIAATRIERTATRASHERSESRRGSPIRMMMIVMMIENVQAHRDESERVVNAS